MTRLHRTVNIAAVVLPFIAVLAAIPMLWNKLVGWSDLLLFGGMYFFSTMGITVGYHRLLTHRAFQTYKPIEYLFAAFGSMAVEGPVIGWVLGPPPPPRARRPRRRPAQPARPRRRLRRNAARPWHAHLGWLFDHPTAQDADKHAPDLLDDRGIRAVHRLFGPLVIAGLAIPFLAGWGIPASWPAA